MNVDLRAFKKITKDEGVYVVVSNKKIKIREQMPASSRQAIRNLVGNIMEALKEYGRSNISVRFTAPHDYEITGTFDPGRCISLNEKEQNEFIKEIERWWEEVMLGEH